MKSIKALSFTQKILLGIIVLGIFTLLVIIGVLFFGEREEGIPQAVSIETNRYALEIADIYEEKEKGLGERDNLCEKCGMLFVFDVLDRYKFWMKDMRFPIDIIWLSGETVVFVAHDVRPDYKGIIDPEKEADRVLEVNASHARSVKIGDTLDFIY